MSGTQSCSVCGRAIRRGAKFCRHCGASNAAILDGDELSADLAPAQTLSTSPPPDGERLFRELCWLCGLPLVVAIVYAIVIRVAGASAIGDVTATLAIASIAFVGALNNLALVRSAIRLPTARDMLQALLVALLTAPALLLAFWVMERLLGFPMMDAYLESYIQDEWPTWVGYLDLALVTPIAEEVLFRGLVQPKLGQVLTQTEAWIVQAALFAAAHLSPVILLTHFAMGLSLGWVRRKSGSVLPGILLHGAWNAWVVWSSSS